MAFLCSVGAGKEGAVPASAKREAPVAKKEPTEAEKRALLQKSLDMGKAAGMGSSKDEDYERPPPVQPTSGAPLFSHRDQY